MNVRKTCVALALLGSLSLAACGDNTHLQRGETDCDSASTDANNAHDASCSETGSNPGNG
jgi:hypothetical protein